MSPSCSSVDDSFAVKWDVYSRVKELGIIYTWVHEIDWAGEYCEEGDLNLVTSAEFDESSTEQTTWAENTCNCMSYSGSVATDIDYNTVNDIQAGEFLRQDSYQGSTYFGLSVSDTNPRSRLKITPEENQPTIVDTNLGNHPNNLGNI